MEGHREKLRDFIELVWDYKIEAILLVVAFTIACVSIAVYAFESKEKSSKPIVSVKKPQEKPAQIFVDIEGAVVRPGVYAHSESARLKDAIDSSGGLSERADKLYFYKNFNQAKILSDQEKLYIPTLEETLQSYQYQTLPPNGPNSLNTSNTQNYETTTFININSASEDELEELPAVGKVTAEKIVTGRPYQTIDELIQRKIINNSTFEKIKKIITVNE